MLEEPAKATVEFVLARAEEAYARVKWELPDDFLSDNAIVRAIYRVDKLSSPGWPYCKHFTTNAQCLGWDGIRFDFQKMQAVIHDVKKYIERPEEYYMRVFVKREAHKMEKVKEGRWRLIMAQPLHVQVVWHMLFDYQNDKEIQETYFIPSQQGLILPHGGWKTYLRQWKSRGYDTGLDKKAWDWNVPWFLLKMDLDFRYRMCRGRLKQRWKTLAIRLYHYAFVEARIMLSNGQVYDQKYPGIMKSGCVNTISSNSHMQFFIHVFACLEQGVSYEPYPVCCGDDTLQRLSQATDLKAYAKFGAIVKSASDGLEFVGHEFVEAGPQPLYAPKHIQKLFHTKDEQLSEIFDAYARMYCKNKIMFDFFVRWAGECGVLISKSHEYYVGWYDYE